MSLENISTVEALLGSRARTWAEATHHGSFVVGQGVPILVVFARETFPVVFARHNWAFFRPFALMGEHVGFEVFEEAAAVRTCTPPFLAGIFISGIGCLG